MKKVMKILGIVVLCIIICIIALVAVLMVKNYFDSKKPLLSDDYYTNFKSDSELEKKYSGKGDFTILSVTYKSDNKSIGNLRIWYPSEMENGTKTYPLIVVANGSNTPALIYQPYFERLASWGFVVIGNDDKQTGTGDTASETLDYMLSLNKDTNSIFCGKIDEDKIGIACAIDIHDNIVLSVADRGRPTSKTLIEIFDKTMTHGMKIISGSQRSYHPLMKHLQADWKKIPSRKQEIEGYTLDRVNKLHEQIKTFFRGKRNVATHYLQGYLALFQYKRKHPLYLDNHICRSLFYQLNCIKTALRNKDICSGVNIYRTFYNL